MVVTGRHGNNNKYKRTGVKLVFVQTLQFQTL